MGAVYFMNGFRERFGEPGRMNGKSGMMLWGIVGHFVRMRHGVVMKTHSWWISLDAQCVMRFRGEQSDNASFQTTLSLVICLYITITSIYTVILITIICTCITIGVG